MIVTSLHPFSLRHTVQSHGWIQLAPWKWNSQRELLSRRDLLHWDLPVTITVSQNTLREIQVGLDSELDNQAADLVKAIVARWFSLKWNPVPAIKTARGIDASIAEYIESGGGRFLRGSTFYEDFAKTVCTINISWTGTQRLVNGLVNKIGNGFFPTPSQVISAGQDTLMNEVHMGFRSRVFYEATQRLIDSGLIDLSGNNSEEAISYDNLISIRGIGPYAASHMAVLLHDFSRVPVDSEVRRFCANRYGFSDDQISSFFDQWGDFRFLGYKLARLTM